MLCEAYEEISGCGWDLGKDSLHYDQCQNLCRSCYIKSKDKNYFINMAVNDYNTAFGTNLTPFWYSIEYIKMLMKNYKYWSMVEESFCCRGLEKGCWQEIYEDGVWGFTLEQVRKLIIGRFIEVSEILSKSNRFFVEAQNDDVVHILCVLRDTEFQHDIKISCSKIDFNELINK